MIPNAVFLHFDMESPGVAISVTPRQIINQSLSHFFHNEKSHFCVLFTNKTPLPAKKFIHPLIFFQKKLLHHEKYSKNIYTELIG